MFKYKFKKVGNGAQIGRKIPTFFVFLNPSLRTVQTSLTQFCLAWLVYSDDQGPV